MTDVDIADFYAARLDEATEDAKYVHRWDCDAFDGGSLGDCNCGVPQMLLADIAAKRAVVEDYRIVLARHAAEKIGGDEVMAAAYDLVVKSLRMVLRRLAAPYADRPDYDPAWRIDG